MLILNWILDALYPENLYCISCGDSMESTTRVHGLCDRCIEKTDWDQEDPFRGGDIRFSFDRFWKCCTYGYSPRLIMNGLKTGGKSYCAKNLGLLLAERVLKGCDACGSDPESFDGILAVPMRQEKKESRGYNQAQLLAEYTAKELGLKNRILKNVLIKTRETPSMRFSDGQTRRSALADVFAVPEEKKYLTAGKKLLLIDDVCTTGSTADACAKALKESGAADVTFLCFACASGRPEDTQQS